MHLRELLAFDSIHIQCHDNPDADTIASGYALYRYCQHAGKQATLFYSGRTPITKPNLLAMVESLHIPLAYEPKPAPCPGLLVTVDCQYGAGNVTHIPASHVAVIDHHIQERELPPLADLRPYLGSCSTLLWLLLEAEGHAFSPEVATALFYGLYTDTNGFAEVRHPSDRDMWDNLVPDERILKKLKRSNLSLDDLAIASAALNALEYHPEGRFVVMGVPACDPNILGFISDLAMQVDAVDVAVVFSHEASGFKFSVRTGVREVKASELANWLVQGGIGSGGGHAEKAGGFINKAMFEKAKPGQSIMDFLLAQVRAYFAEYEIVDCASSQGVMLEGMAAYEKLPARIGYVPCAELFPDKTMLHVRMLEGDMDIRATEDTYLMIGISGEVYCMGKQAFATNYTPLDETFKVDVDYPPVVLDKDAGARVYLLRVAKACQSRKSRVLARQLTRGMKVFTRWDAENYLKGEPGDWVAVRHEDSCDAYIIKQSLFPGLYTPCQEAE